MASVVYIEKDDEFNASFLRMFLLGVIVISPIFLSGLNSAYTTVALPQMNLSLNDASWFGSISTIASFITIILSGIIIDKYGRKSALIFALLPSLAGWVLLLWNFNMFTILLGQILNGFTIGSGGYSSQVYTGECIMVNHIRLRGSYIMWSSVSSAAATMLMFALAIFLHYRQICLISWIITVILLCLMCFFIPESPSWLYHEGRMGDAEWSQKKLRIAQPILKLPKGDWKTFLQSSPQLSVWSRIQLKVAKLWQPNVWKPLTNFSVFIILYSFTGTNCVMIYMIDIFNGSIYGYDKTLVSGSSSYTRMDTGLTGNATQPLVTECTVNPYWYSLVSGMLMLVSAILSSIGLPYFGVKKLLVCSALGTFVAMGALGYTAVAADGPLYGLRIAAVWMVAFCYGCSATTPYAAAGDVLPADAKGFASIVVLNGSVWLAATQMMFPYFCVAIGAYAFYVFSLLSILCAIHAYSCLTEVVGKTLDEMNCECSTQHE